MVGRQVVSGAVGSAAQSNSNAKPPAGASVASVAEERFQCGGRQRVTGGLVPVRRRRPTADRSQLTAAGEARRRRREIAAGRRPEGGSVPCHARGGIGGPGPFGADGCDLLNEAGQVRGSRPKRERDDESRAAESSPHGYSCHRLSRKRPLQKRDRGRLVHLLSQPGEIGRQLLGPAGTARLPQPPPPLPQPPALPAAAVAAGAAAVVLVFVASGTGFRRRGRTSGRSAHAGRQYRRAAGPRQHGPSRTACSNACRPSRKTSTSTRANGRPSDRRPSASRPRTAARPSVPMPVGGGKIGRRWRPVAIRRRTGRAESAGRRTSTDRATCRVPAPDGNWTTTASSRGRIAVAGVRNRPRWPAQPW